MRIVGVERRDLVERVRDRVKPPALESRAAGVVRVRRIVSDIRPRPVLGQDAAVGVVGPGRAAQCARGRIGDLKSEQIADLIADANFRVSTPPAPAQCGAAGTGARKPKIDWLGRKVVFESDQPLKPGDANGTRDIYLRDLSQAGLMRVSETLSGADATGASTEPSISGDGEAIAYVSEATNLDSADDDTNNKSDVHVRSLRDAPTRRLSKTRDGLEADSDSRRPALNYNGTKLAFDSDAGNLAPGAAGGVQNVFQRVNPLTSELIFAAGFD